MHNCCICRFVTENEWVPKSNMVNLIIVLYTIQRAKQMVAELITARESGSGVSVCITDDS